VVVLAALNRAERLAGVPVGAKRRASGADQPVLQGLAPRGREPRDQAREVVAGSELLPMKSTFSEALPGTRVAISSSASAPPKVRVAFS